MISVSSARWPFLPLFALPRHSAAYLDGVKILVFESCGSERMLGPQEGNFSPLGFMQHDLFITPHVCGSALWAVRMCRYVPPLRHGCTRASRLVIHM